jgi:hypothetical protein
MRARLVRVRVRVIGLGAGRSRVGAPSQRGDEGLGKGLDEGLGKGLDEGLGKGVDEGLGKGVASPLFEVSSVAAAAALSSSASNILMAWASSCYHVRCKDLSIYMSVQVCEAGLTEDRGVAAGCMGLGAGIDRGCTRGEK